MDPRKLFVTPFEKGVEYSQVSLSHNDNNSDTLCTRAHTFDVCWSKRFKKIKKLSGNIRFFQNRQKILSLRLRVQASETYRFRV